MTPERLSGNVSVGVCMFFYSFVMLVKYHINHLYFIMSHRKQYLASHLQPVNFYSQLDSRLNKYNQRKNTHNSVNDTDIGLIFVVVVAESLRLKAETDDCNRLYIMLFSTGCYVKKVKHVTNPF